MWPEKFQNKTNGVTPRRWIAFCNPAQSAVVTKWLGSDEWILDADKLKGLVQVGGEDTAHGCGAEWDGMRWCYIGVTQGRNKDGWIWDRHG